MTRDPARRLGASEADAEDIKRHLFFKDVNFDDVYNKRIPPPYFPVIGSATDTSNFDQEFTREQPTLTPVHTQLSAQDQQEFVGFSWVSYSLHSFWIFSCKLTKGKKLIILDRTMGKCLITLVFDL